MKRKAWESTLFFLLRNMTGRQNVPQVGIGKEEEGCRQDKKPAQMIAQKGGCGQGEQMEFDDRADCGVPEDF